MYYTKEEKNALIDRVNQHNRYCLQIMDMFDEVDVDEDMLTTINADLYTVGIYFCCAMRSCGFDAAVDRVSGACVNVNEVDMNETICEGEDMPLRYLIFAWADTHEEV